MQLSINNTVNDQRQNGYKQMLKSIIASYYSKCDEVENQSDHAPIVLELDIPIDHHIHVPINHKPRKKWNIASNDQIGNYKLALDNSF